MTGDRDFLHIFSVWTVPVCLLRIRGQLAIGAHLRATDLSTLGSSDPPLPMATLAFVSVRGTQGSIPPA